MVALRRSHQEMGHVAFAAYGGDDVAGPPYGTPTTDAEKAALSRFEDEVIDRLFALNAQRAAEERAQAGREAAATAKPAMARGTRKKKGDAGDGQGDLGIRQWLSETRWPSSTRGEVVMRVWKLLFAIGNVMRTEARGAEFRVTGFNQEGIQVHVETGGRDVVLTWVRLRPILRRYRELRLEIRGGNGVLAALDRVWAETGVVPDHMNESQYWAIVCEYRRRYRAVRTLVRA